MLLNLFKGAAKLAADNQLPPETPAAVLRYFQKGIHLDLADWLLFDETALVSALEAWSMSDKAEHKWIQRLSRAFLRRERLYRGLPVGHLKIHQIMELPAKLQSAGLEQGIDWGLDNGEHLPYKGVFYRAAKGGAEEEQSTLSILLSDGDKAKRGQAIETRSNILKGLDNNSEPITRVYIDREKLETAVPVLKSLKIVPGGAA